MEILSPVQDSILFYFKTSSPSFIFGNSTFPIYFPFYFSLIDNLNRASKGYYDYDWIEKEPLLENIRNHPQYKQIIKKMKQQ